MENFKLLVFLILPETNEFWNKTCIQFIFNRRDL
jgi:hypothetical protein